MLACKDVGSGRLPKEEVLIEHILHSIARPKDLAGVRVAVTAGPTQEALDPVRYLTNHSTGKMGYALARAAAMRGAEVTLIHGQTALPPVKFTTDVPVTTARQMYEAVTDRFDTTDVLIMAAAVADYRPATVANDKIKKEGGRPLHPRGAHRGYPWHHRPPQDPPVPVRLFHGDPGPCGKLLREACQEKIWTWWWPTTSRWPVQALGWIPTWSPSSPRTAQGSCP